MPNPGSTFDAAITATVSAHLKDKNDLVILASGSVTPPTTANVFQKGALYLRTDPATGVSGTYQNNGTSAAPVWDLVGPSAAGVLSLGGLKIARGVSAVTGTLTVVTGLATVVAVIATAQDDLDGDALAGVSATIGNQAGAPAAGSVILKAWKVTTGGAAGNPTLIAATAAKSVNWIAIGT